MGQARRTPTVRAPVIGLARARVVNDAAHRTGPRSERLNPSTRGERVGERTGDAGRGCSLVELVVLDLGHEAVAGRGHAIVGHGVHLSSGWAGLVRQGRLVSAISYTQRMGCVGISTVPDCAPAVATAA